MENTTTNLSEEESSLISFYQSLDSRFTQIEQNSRPDPYQKLIPFAKDLRRQSQIQTLVNIYEGFEPLIVYQLREAKKTLLPFVVCERKNLDKWIKIDRNACSFINSLNSFELRHNADDEEVMGIEFYGEYHDPNEPKASCYESFFAIHHKVQILFKQLVCFRKKRKEEEVEEVFEQNYLEYDMIHHSSALASYNQLRDKLSKEYADVEFLRGHDIDPIVKAYVKFKGSIGAFFKSIQGRNFVENDLPSLLEYVLRLRIIATYLPQKSDPIKIKKVQTKESSFTQYVLKRAYADLTISFIHNCIDDATLSDIIGLVLRALIKRKVLRNKILYRDFKEEFPNAAKIVSKYTFSRIMGPGVDYSDDEMDEICKSHRDFIDDNLY